MGLTNLEHHIQNGVPSGCLFQSCIGEHATIPADMLNASFGCILEPISSAANDIEFAVGVIGWTVLACLVVRSRAMHVAIVLRDVEVDRPRTQFISHLFIRCIEFILAITRLNQRAFWALYPSK